MTVYEVALQVVLGLGVGFSVMFVVFSGLHWFDRLRAKKKAEYDEDAANMVVQARTHLVGLPDLTTTLHLAATLSPVMNFNTPGAHPVFPDEGLVLGEVIARRRWVMDMGQGWLVSSGQSPILWPPEMELEAQCCHGCETSPNEACPDPNGCGIYGWKPGKGDTSAWGEVKIHGVILEGEDGYRAQFAVPYRINRTLFMKAYYPQIGEQASRLLDIIAEKYHMDVVDVWEASGSLSESSLPSL